jgi:UDP-N-acetylglucosamine 3-dehydrogenase
MMRVGVVGVGAMGRNHARVLAELPEVELLGVADTNPETARIVAKQFSTTAFGTHRDLLAEKPDAVVVAVPTAVHEQVALDVVERGCHVLVEKPLADSVESGRRIIAAAERHNVTLMVGHIERFNPAVQVLKAFLDPKKLLLLEFTRVGPFPPRVKDVGVLVDLAVHDIDLALHLAEGEVTSLHALTSTAEGLKEDSAVLLLSLDTGVIVRITTNWLTPFKVRRIACAMTDAYVEADLLRRRVSTFTQSDEGAYTVRESAVPFQEPLLAEISEFLNAIAERRTPAVTGTDGLRALDIAIRAQQSGRS